MYCQPPKYTQELADMFPLQCELVEATGISDGIILKFKTFYLKIYNDKKMNGYVIQGFLYGKQNPVIIDRVKETQMRAYAAQFTMEDHLRWMIAAHTIKY